ncbi:MAG: D-alanine--D-alanine ligase [Planctomycetes bacterium]|nr:D-alanine--D-alanine ligase [Planctomycetota bacterium]
MRVLILYDAPRAGSRTDELDALEQARVVGGALSELGHEVHSFGVGLDLSALEREIERARPELAFNLVESLAGHGRLIAVVPQLLDAFGVPYVGCPASAIHATSGKLLAKERLHDAGLPTPAWVSERDLAHGAGGVEFPDTWIVKSVWEHASVGLDEDSVRNFASADELANELARRRSSLGGEGFAELYVEGREFNLALLGNAGGEPEVLPHAEIVFEGYGSSKRRVVGWRAKWDPESYEYHHTPRRFDFPASDGALLREIGQLAKACWALFDLHGWARVDFRVDAAGRPWILEINTNPCLSPDAGFAAALERAGIPFRAAIARIVSDLP